jgi:hypothetical protein
LEEVGWEVVDSGDIKFGEFKADKIGKMVNPTYVKSIRTKIDQRLVNRAVSFMTKLKKGHPSSNFR